MRLKNTHEEPFDDVSFSKLFDELYEALCYFAMKFTGEKHAAEDIVQEQFVVLWENRKKLKDIDYLKSYLYTSVKNRSISYLRKQYVKAGKTTPDELLHNEERSNLPEPSEMLESKELELIIEKALDALPEKCRIIFNMKKFGELSNKEVAGKLNISVKTVENQTTIALKKIMAFIASNYLILWLMFFMS